MSKNKNESVVYSQKQDRFNYVSHFLGVPVGIAILVFAIILLIKDSLNIVYFIGLCVFALTTILLYLVSAFYHHAPQNTERKRIRRIIDHCTIYALIAGTYTPICLFIMSEHVIGLVVLIVQWSLAIIGILINAFALDNKVVKVISMILYIAMGWMILFTTGFRYIPTLSFVFILAGGIVYTIGSILYGIGHKEKWFHSVFHVFVLLGTITQAIGIILLFVK